MMNIVEIFAVPNLVEELNYDLKGMTKYVKNYAIKNGISKKTLDDNARNHYVEKIASKITEEDIPFDEPSTDTIEYLQKFAITLGIDISNTEELVHEAFLYLSMKKAGDIDPLTKGDQFGAGFS